MNNIRLALISTLLVLTSIGCSKNGEHATSAESAEAKADPSVAIQDVTPTPTRTTATGQKLTADQRIAAVSGEWILADYTTAKAAWDQFARDTAQKKVAATDDLEFMEDYKIGRLEEELERAASIGDKSVMIVSQGSYQLDVNFEAEGYQRQNKGTISWDTPYKGLVMADR